MIPRLLRDKLRDRIESTPAVVLLGARQVGKTTLAKQISENRNSIYLDLENPEDLRKLSDPVSYLGSHRDKLVVLDEIQRAPEIFPVLRGLIDRNNQSGKHSEMFLLLGSASLELLRQSSESLAGRITHLELPVFNVLETVSDQQAMRRLWFRGGFPKSFAANDASHSMIWLDDFIRSYLEREVPNFGFRLPANRLRRLWTMVAHLQGETIDCSTLGGNLEVSSKTVSYYLDVLVSLLLVRRLQPWFGNTKKRLIKSPRFYIRDSGILHRLLGINDYESLLSHPVLGKSWEGFVIENIQSVLPHSAEMFFYRTSAGAEIDLVIQMSSVQTIAIEIKYGTSVNRSKHFSRTCTEVNATQKYVVYSGDDEYSLGNDVTMISLPALLDKLASQSYD